jgi:hypothetical protein
VAELLRSVALAVIASGQTKSGAVSVSNETQPVALDLPAAFTGAAITFEASTDGGATFHQVMEVDGAAAYSVTVAAAKFVPLDPRVFAGIGSFKVVSGSAEGAERSVRVVMRKVG